MGKGDRRARKRGRQKKQKAGVAALYAPQGATKPGKVKEVAAGGGGRSAVRPTEERMARGKWSMPSGRGSRELPAVDMAADVVGLMYERGFITWAQEQAARRAQEAWEDYRSEIGVSTGRSCLDISPVGYQGDDGDPAKLEAWRRITAKMSYWQEGAIYHTVICGRAPGNLPLLRDALDVVAGIAPA